MKTFNKIILRTGKPLLALALIIGITSVNTACFGWYHQPKVPKGMERFKK